MPFCHHKKGKQEKNKHQQLNPHTPPSRKRLFGGRAAGKQQLFPSPHPCSHSPTFSLSGLYAVPKKKEREGEARPPCPHRRWESKEVA
ncbi:hypothetical protein Taro_028971 [Colocasia esculenta]|uniref:Uncharacterized protein n=1 Tax=Colocasia esculenta TaxID=4460 RepID=A0A843VCN7_COLES|nr:hypothetical protein [Colocasia esculenta]